MTNDQKNALSVTPRYLIVASLLFLTLFITDRFNGALIGLYLCAVCTFDPVLNISRHMPRDDNKVALLAFIITSFASSVAFVVTRRHEVRTTEISEAQNE